MFPRCPGLRNTANILGISRAGWVKSAIVLMNVLPDVNTCPNRKKNRSLLPEETVKRTHLTG